MQPVTSMIAAITVLLTLFLSAGFSPVIAAEAPAAATDLSPILQKYGEQLGAVTSDAQAIGLFVSHIGPALGLNDVASTLAAKSIPPKIAKELGVQELTASVHRLIAGLAAWQVADRVTQSLTEHANPLAAPQAGLVSWIQTVSPMSLLDQTTKELADTAGADHTALAVSAGRLALNAHQRTITEWWQLKTWRDRVRTVRGRNRLCGTWQWVIHNHQQHHQEQKLSLIFPPPGPEYPLASGLVETVVLGENVYLRWESNGQIQEDSLQFTKEGKGLEGTFVNSQGGWGSISGKRTSDCKP